MWSLTSSSSFKRSVGSSEPQNTISLSPAGSPRAAMMWLTPGACSECQVIAAQRGLADVFCAERAAQGPTVGDIQASLSPIGQARVRLCMPLLSVSRRALDGYVPIKTIYSSAPDGGMTQLNRFAITKPARAADLRARLAARS